ncbi:hypothetical protein IV38_GL001102 [Lactobacillus selangorensis]|uniref:ABC transmembrane type-1 domain-containing protein n=1 Tax=Lactobacillus selangorensis TaxID=81857 RepID=A0A0R2FWY7_9LACO|nr:phosphonate ABC transporter, permease protein PhnE [Lactobacillus selangorensis]KRN28894.1 hypothetical protein IV38_GL001102 [Lactobacillus selangorensis]KRN32696.1 hypothetical protein IV40_GL000751 [Lactobacillus selangorensis]
MMTTTTIDQSVRKGRWQYRVQWLFWGALVIGLYVWAGKGLQFSGVQASAADVSKSILHGILNPDWRYVYNGSGEDLTSEIIQTIAIAFLGTFISAFISIPFAFWAARTEKGKWHLRSTSGKFVLTLIRTFPEIVLAIMFIKSVGPGSYAGVLAVGVHSIGMLGKLFSEGIEEMDRGPEEALVSVGGNRTEVLCLATLPTLLPEFISYTLYRFEISVRSASILGMIGAGGIGTPLIFAIQTRSWSRVGIILIGIVVMVMGIDWLSGQLRKKLA